ncbi:MAG: aldehyde dehydrogenase family protein, partial [Propionibacterium sp.]|nr:aldehyde dehydrogenase family protein [Propionibacterium sp.]
YGLTSGIHSLDSGQVSRWMERIEAGNLYVNRGITGAIVRRQPFGGWKLSQVGPGAKAGGPNYLFGLVDWEPAEGEFDADVPAPTDVSALGVERNVFRYLPCDDTLIRLTGSGSRGDLDRVVRAAERAGARVRVSTPEDESDDALHERVRTGSLHDDGTVTRIRVVGRDTGLRAALAGDVTVAVYEQPVTGSMRLEMLPFLKEQAVTLTAHRYGDPDPRFVELEI